MKMSKEISLEMRMIEEAKGLLKEITGEMESKYNQ
jgi:hypothetical protein